MEKDLNSNNHIDSRVQFCRLAVTIISLNMFTFKILVSYGIFIIYDTHEGEATIVYVSDYSALNTTPRGHRQLCLHVHMQ
jgi:hypothetical protein